MDLKRKERTPKARMKGKEGDLIKKKRYKRNRREKGSLLIDFKEEIRWVGGDE